MLVQRGCYERLTHGVQLHAGEGLHDRLRAGGLSDTCMVGGCWGGRAQSIWMYATPSPLTRVR